MDIEIAAAFCLMPLTMVIAAQGWVWMTCVFLFLSLALFLYKCKMSHTFGTRFFLGWGIVSFFFLLAIFELEVVPYLEILFIENFILMCFVGCMCMCIFLAKSSITPGVYAGDKDVFKAELVKKIRCEVCSCLQPLRTYHCNLCGVCIYRRDHHSVWLDTCIGAKNQKMFIGALTMLILSCVYSSNLTLTTICHPTLVAGLFLMPDDCSDVFGDIHIGICFVSAVYSLMITVVGIYLLSQQLYFISSNSTFQEYKLGQLGSYSNGFFRNVKDFLRGYP